MGASRNPLDVDEGEMAVLMLPFVVMLIWTVWQLLVLGYAAYTLSSIGSVGAVRGVLSSPRMRFRIAVNSLMLLWAACKLGSVVLGARAIITVSTSVLFSVDVALRSVTLILYLQSAAWLVRPSRTQHWLMVAMFAGAGITTVTEFVGYFLLAGDHEEGGLVVGMGNILFQLPALASVVYIVRYMPNDTRHELFSWFSIRPVFFRMILVGIMLTELVFCITAILYTNDAWASSAALAGMVTDQVAGVLLLLAITTVPAKHRSSELDSASYAAL